MGYENRPRLFYHGCYGNHPVSRGGISFLKTRILCGFLLARSYFFKNRYFSRSTVSLSITSNMARAGKTIGRLWSGDAHLCSFNRKYTGLNLFWTNRVFFKSLSVYHNTLCDLPHLERGRSSVWQDCIYQPQTPKDIGSVVAVHSCCQKTPRKSRR